MNTFWKYWGKENDRYRISISTTISGREGRSAVVLVPTKPPLTLRFTNRRECSMCPRSPGSSVPPLGCFFPAATFWQSPPRGYQGNPLAAAHLVNKRVRTPLWIPRALQPHRLVHDRISCWVQIRIWILCRMEILSVFWNSLQPWSTPNILGSMKQ